LPKFGASPLMFTQWLKLATSNVVHSFGLPRPIINSHIEEKVDVVPYYKSSPKFWGSPLIFVTVCATAEVSNFKVGIQLGLAKAHHENHTQRKRGRGLELGKLPYIWGSPSIFLQWPRCSLSVSGASCTYCKCYSQHWLNNAAHN